MLIYCMHLSLVIQPIMNRASFYLYLCLRLYWKHEKTRSKTKTSRDQCSFLGVILIEVMDPDNGLASERGYDTR